MAPCSFLLAAEGEISLIISHRKNSLRASNSSSNFELEGSFVPRGGDEEGGRSDSLSLCCNGSCGSRGGRAGGCGALC